VNKAKLIAALVAAALAAVGVLYPELREIATVLAGLAMGKEFLPQAGK
jgi:hypothetical protein